MKAFNMTETYYAGTYWLGRKESAEACARRAEAFFRLLTFCDPTFTRWFELADSRQEAMKHQIQTNAATFLLMFGQKENQQLEDGFFLHAWNGASDDDASGLNISCGSSSHYLCDACVLSPPSEGPVAERIISSSVLSQVLRAMALAWDPEWGIATSETHRDDVLKVNVTDTFVGWVMYFSRRRGTVPPLPPPVRVEPVENQGTLVILTPERFTASNPEHVALAARVQELLSQAGLLGPLQPWEAQPLR